MTTIHRINSISIAPALWLGFTLALFFICASAAQASTIGMLAAAQTPGLVEERPLDTMEFSGEVAGGVISGSAHATAFGSVQPIIGGDGVFRSSGSFSASADVYASYSRGENLILGFAAQAAGQGGWGVTPLAHSWGEVTVRDSFTILGENSGQFGSSILNWDVRGEASGSLLGSSHSNIIQEGSIHFGVNTQFLDFNSDGTTGDYGVFTPRLSAEIDLIDGTVYYEAYLEWNLTVNWGFMDLGSGYSATLTSITFPDGTTPESHGLEIVFESGMTSPNLIVPEPSTFALAALGLLGIGYCRRRQA